MKSMKYNSQSVSHKDPLIHHFLYFQDEHDLSAHTSLKGQVVPLGNKSVIKQAPMMRQTS